MILLKSAGITFLAFVLSLLLLSPLAYSFTSIFSTPEKEDFTISDFYVQVANKRPVRSLDKDIVLVDIGDMQREEIALVLQAISLCKPRALGIDILFEGRQDCDSLLIKALLSNQNIILPVELKQEADGNFKIASTPFFYNDGNLPEVSYGASNFPGKHKGATIREFRPEFKLSRGLMIPSFPLAIALISNPEIAEAAQLRGNDIEVIDFPSHEFNIIKALEIADHTEELTDKIVLIGSLTDISDLHASPLNSHTSGLYIQACALSTILNSKYYYQNSPILDWVIATVLCYLVVMFGLLCDKRIKPLINRLMQFILVYSSVVIGYYLFLDYHIIVNVSYTLLIVTFGIFAADIWNGSNGLYSYIKERRQRNEKI